MNPLPAVIVLLAVIYPRTRACELEVVIELLVGAEPVVAELKSNVSSADIDASPEYSWQVIVFTPVKLPVNVAVTLKLAPPVVMGAYQTSVIVPGFPTLSTGPAA